MKDPGRWILLLLDRAVSGTCELTIGGYYLVGHVKMVTLDYINSHQICACYKTPSPGCKSCVWCLHFNALLEGSVGIILNGEGLHFKSMNT